MSTESQQDAAATRWKDVLDRDKVEWLRVLEYVNEVQAINGYRPFDISAAIEHLRARAAAP